MDIVLFKQFPGTHKELWLSSVKSLTLSWGDLCMHLFLLLCAFICDKVGFCFKYMINWKSKIDESLEYFLQGSWENLVQARDLQGVFSLWTDLEVFFYECSTEAAVPQWLHCHIGEGDKHVLPPCVGTYFYSLCMLVLVLEGKPEQETNPFY